MIILAIETSCDETSVALIENESNVLVNLVSSQVDLHSKYGGVVPEIACRKHLEVINLLIEEALCKVKLKWRNLNAIAVTVGPGLIGAVLIGAAAAKSIAGVLDLPFIAVNHLESHIYANFLEHKEIKFPLVALVVSGGHTNLFYMQEHLKYKLLGQTKDDAAGEAFDKIAKFLKLGYPGGPIIDKLAQKGNPDAINFPRAYLKEEDKYNFSFSGLKTAVINFHKKEEFKKFSLEDICASFQKAVVDVLADKTIKAAQNFKVNQILLSGGVACNTLLRSQMRREAERFGIELFFPSEKLCTDNAAMVGCAAYYKLKAGKTADLTQDAYASLSLEE